MNRYIGITGVMPGNIGFVKKEYQKIAHPKQEIGLQVPNLMCGILVSTTTLRGERNAYPERYPRVADIPGMLVPQENILYIAHFYGRDDDLAENLPRLVEVCGKNLSGIQLNMSWPDGYVLWEFKKKYPFLPIILSINRKAIIRKSFGITLAKVQAYEDVVDGLIFDLSEGNGIPLAVEETREFLRIFSPLEKKDVRITIAGGLYGAALKEKEVADLIRTYPGVGIDAESRLRMGGGLDKELVKRYLNRGIKLMSHQAAV